MFSVASKLPKPHSTEQHGTIVGLQPGASQPSPFFPPGSHLLSLGQYLVNLSVCDGNFHSCMNNFTGDHLSCQVFDLGTFQSKAPLFFSECEGVCRPRDVHVVDKKVFVITKRTYGDLHNYLKRRKKLSEAQAAPLFLQIVSLVKDAHRKNITLRDLKLKKFVFEDSDRYMCVLCSWVVCIHEVMSPCLAYVGPCEFF